MTTRVFDGLALSTTIDKNMGVAKAAKPALTRKFLSILTSSRWRSLSDGPQVGRYAKQYRSQVHAFCRSV